MAYHLAISATATASPASPAPTLTISGFTTAGSAEYRAVVTDANGVTTTSNAATLTIYAPPSIATPPAKQFATLGQTGSESFSVVAANGTSAVYLSVAGVDRRRHHLR